MYPSDIGFNYRGILAIPPLSSAIALEPSCLFQFQRDSKYPSLCNDLQLDGLCFSISEGYLLPLLQDYGMFMISPRFNFISISEGYLLSLLPRLTYS